MGSVFVLILGWILGLLTPLIHEWRNDATHERILIRKVRSAAESLYKAIHINKALVEAGIKKSLSDVVSGTMHHGVQQLPPPPEVSVDLSQVADGLEALPLLENGELPEIVRALDRDLESLSCIFREIEAMDECEGGEGERIYMRFYDNFSQSVERLLRASRPSNECWIKRRWSVWRRCCISSTSAWYKREE